MGWGIAFRPTGGTYLVTDQVNHYGNNDLDIVATTSTDPYDWSAAEVVLSGDVNSHDSRPELLGGGFASARARCPSAK